jgi:SAM-dependent methyltransferase
MFRIFADNRNPDSIASRLRQKRFAFFSSFVEQLPDGFTILDVGGTEAYWTTMMQHLSHNFKVTILNLQMHSSSRNFTYVQGDARELKFANKSFDVVFSNSVIEHVGSNVDQVCMANEVVRVGKHYFVQTPNRYFPIEPHFVFPFFQFLPVRARIWLVMHFNLGWIKKQPQQEQAERVVNEIRLLGRSDVQRLFPAAKIYDEKILGLTKSFVAYGGWEKEQ